MGSSTDGPLEPLAPWPRLRGLNWIQTRTLTTSRRGRHRRAPIGADAGWTQILRTSCRRRRWTPIRPIPAGGLQRARTDEGASLDGKSTFVRIAAPAVRSRHRRERDQCNDRWAQSPLTTGHELARLRVDFEWEATRPCGWWKRAWQVPRPSLTPSEALLKAYRQPARSPRPITDKKITAAAMDEGKLVNLMTPRSASPSPRRAPSCSDCATPTTSASFGDFAGRE